MELLVTAAIFGYIIYLRYYADLRSKSEQDYDALQDGIKLYTNGQYNEALDFFSQYLTTESKSSVAYLYKARCYRALGNVASAIQALKAGESYDATVADLHLELGQIRYEQADYPEAFQEFDKAVFYSKGQQPEAYRWRALARQQLNQFSEVQQDMAKADSLLEMPTNTVAAKTATYRSFSKNQFLLHVFLVFVNSALLLTVIKKTTIIHPPFLLAAVSAAFIGFLEPKKGWILAIVQALILWVGYTFFTETPTQSGTRELQFFGLYGAIILTFVGSFIGGLLKRQLIR